MNGFRVHLFGRFEVAWDGKVVEGLEARKVRELFCYLLLFRSRTHARDVLADLGWQDRSTSQAKKYLRQALWQLQTALTVPSADEALLLVEQEWVQINPRASLWLDVTMIEMGYLQVKGIRGRDLQNEQAALIGAALHHYRGDLLEGCYRDWCIFERERFQGIYLAMLDKLVNYCEAHGRYEEGLEHGAKILRCDRARERTHRRLMRLYYLAGNRTGALRQYRACVDALAQELQVEPAGSTRALYEEIRSDQLGSVEAARPPAPMPVSGTGVTLPEVLERLDDLETVLASIREQLLQNAIATHPYR
ncbi:MAG: BTAD domain-containing putative transcriptional regulator [Chloroflexota bacterium]|nr:BTAD domain-containing putative transcriptional regulator [Chloroflexota bacterium]